MKKLIAVLICAATLIGCIPFAAIGFESDSPKTDRRIGLYEYGKYQGKKYYLYVEIDDSVYEISASEELTLSKTVDGESIIIKKYDSLDVTYNGMLQNETHNGKMFEVEENTFASGESYELHIPSTCMKTYETPIEDINIKFTYEDLLGCTPLIAYPYCSLCVNDELWIDAYVPIGFEGNLTIKSNSICLREGENGEYLLAVRAGSATFSLLLDGEAVDEGFCTVYKEPREKGKTIEAFETFFSDIGDSFMKILGLPMALIGGLGLSLIGIPMWVMVGVLRLVEFFEDLFHRA